jgi:hypothetical protein
MRSGAAYRLRHTRQTHPRIARIQRAGFQCLVQPIRDTLAIEWARTGIEPDQEAQVVRSALSGDTATATRIVDATVVEELQRALADRHGWYRQDEIDELSEEESWVIASRLVQRMLATIDLYAQRQEALRRVLAHASVAVLKTAAPGTPTTREKLLREAMLNAACGELQPAEVEALSQAIARGGHRPVAGEF